MTSLTRVQSVNRVLRGRDLILYLVDYTCLSMALDDNSSFADASTSAAKIGENITVVMDMGVAVEAHED